ncbi:MAG: hypothetical protein WCI73_20280, partial [Phycisphaerae bacterium]
DSNPAGSPVTGVTWTQKDVPVGTYTYMIKAVKLEHTPGGTYYNNSLGTTVTVTVTPAPMTAPSNAPATQGVQK